MHATRTLAPFLTLALLSACGDADSAGTPTAPEGSTTAVPTTVATTIAPGPGGSISWTGPFEVTVGDGWVVQDCDGERTHVCVVRDGAVVGDVELLAGYPLDGDQLAQPPDEVAVEWADDFVENFRKDRAEGCPDFTFQGDEVAHVDVLGRPGARSGFTLTAGDGTVVERVVNHYVVLDGTMAIVNTDAYATDHGCLGPSEYDPSFSPPQLAAFEPHLDALVSSAPPPRR